MPWSDKELLQRAVHGARWDISHGREPGPEHWQAACFGFTEAFGSLIDPLAEQLKDRAMEQAVKHGTVDTQAGECDSEMMDLFLQAVEGAFWLGMTHGHVIAGGSVSLPYRLFPEVQGLAG